MNFRCLLFALCIIACKSHGQSIGAETGARSFGLGNTNLLLKDAYAVFNNISGISETERSAFIAYDNRFGLSELQTLAAGYIHPFDFGTFGLSFFRFGGELFSQQGIGLGYADKIGIVELGIKVNYLQTSISGFGTSNGIVTELGLSAEVLHVLSIGMRIYNLNQASLVNNEQVSQNVPTVVGIGLSYTPEKRIKLNVQLDQDLDSNTNFKAGLEFSIIEEVTLRAGINTEPVQNFFGLGFREKAFSLDYAIGTSSDLGLSHNASLSYEFGKSK